MPIVAKESAGKRPERELIPSGPQRAVCVNVVDLGTHKDNVYNKMKRLVRITFELSDIRDDFEVDGQMKNLPRLIGRQYNMSLSDRATLRQHLQSWRKKPFTPEELKGFDLANLVGVPCLINVGHYVNKAGETRAGLDGILPLMDGMTKPAPEGETYYYSIDDHGRAIPEAVPEFLRNQILESEELSGGVGAPAAEQAPPVVSTPSIDDVDIDEDLPF